MPNNIAPNTMKNLFLLATAFCSIGLLFNSCQSSKKIVSVIDEKPQQNFRLNQPIIVALQDLRTEAERLNLHDMRTAHVTNKDVTVESIKQGLQRIYGNAIVFKPYWETIPNNAVAIKITIRRIDGEGGFRTFQPHTVHSQIAAAANAALPTWGGRVSEAIASQPISQNLHAQKARWYGTALLDISFVDNLFNDNKTFDFPFVGENTQSNTWGLRSGAIASQHAWNRASSNLLKFIDAVMMRVVERQ